MTGKTTNLILFQCFWNLYWTHLHIGLVPQCSPDQGNRWTPDSWDVWKGGRKTQKASHCNPGWILLMLSNLSRRPTKKSSFRASLSATGNFLLVFLEDTFVVNVGWIFNHNVSSPANDIQGQPELYLDSPGHSTDAVELVAKQTEEWRRPVGRLAQFSLSINFCKQIQIARVHFTFLSI